LCTLVALVVREPALAAVARPAVGTLIWAVAKMHPLVAYPRAGLGIHHLHLNGLALVWLDMCARSREGATKFILQRGQP
jgi:hypothetical protein